MRRKFFVGCCNAAVLVFAGCVYAAASQTPDNHDEIFKWIIGGLCSAFFAICTMILVKVDKNQTKLFEMHGKTERDITELQTIVHRCGSCNEGHK